MFNQNSDNSDSDDPDYSYEIKKDLVNNFRKSENIHSRIDYNEVSMIASKKRKKNHENSSYVKIDNVNVRISPLETSENILEECCQSSSSNEKTKADVLWKDFLTDTAISCGKNSKISIIPPNSMTTNFQNCNVLADSADTEKKYSSKVTVNKSNKTALMSNRNQETYKQLTKTILQKKIGSQSVSSILQTINKKPKLTTLEKSKLDWNTYKEENNLQDEISTFNRGKSGYLEKQDFLSRTDFRQFEIEKELRHNNKSKEL
ncbi:craniofacial development protein 1 isoform X1 [Copidosoma floridanum]|uniref:craniofacial development protein 1 isoform X1 n=1 Tax=Copidosoma floridanum TaxID=29053 RepID=UPI0006C95697|nr:craniofacial development protein 1 isoform X1 [Copidosoma floridanum]